MYHTAKFDRMHLELMDDQQITAGVNSNVDDTVLSVMEASPWSFTLLVDGAPIMSYGVMEYWPGRGEAWAFIDRNAGPHMVAIHRKAKELLIAADLERVEANVICDFDAAHRWCKLLGFKLEAECRRKFFPTGEDAALYARVRE